MSSFSLPDDVKATPVLDQYRKWKGRYPDFLLFFRMGDFYELFFEDAKTASKILDIALTSRDKDRKIPMAGVPYHSVENYLGRLMKKGFKAAICEQITEGDGKTLVDRKVVRLLTPGTYVPEESGQDGVLAAVKSLGGEDYVLGSLNPATGELKVGVMTEGDCRGFLTALENPEILTPKGQGERKILESLDIKSWVTLPSQAFDPLEGTRFLKKLWSLGTLRGFGIEDGSPEAGAAFSLVRYLEETQFTRSKHVTGLSPMADGSYLHLDVTTQRNLELVDGDGPSLYSSLNLCKTPMGKRTLRDWILRPLTDPRAIESRLDKEEIIMSFPALMSDLRESLSMCGDLERALARLNMKSGTPKDMALIRDTLKALPSIKEAMASMGLGGFLPFGDWECLGQKLSDFLEENPSKILGSGKVIKDGANSDLDKWRSFLKDGQSWLEGFLAEERRRLKAPKLKVGYSRVFGYYIEMGKGALRDFPMPEDYQRRQTLVSSERFTNPKLMEFEDKMNQSDEEIKRLEALVYSDLVKETLSFTWELQNLGKSLGELDVLASLAHISKNRRYARPVINSGSYINLKGCRHPVVEVVQNSQAFVPNDLRLDDERRIAIVTGPNMAGKSTYLRTGALLVIMAQMGSFIPAEEGEIGLFDRVFTRLGARDELSRGNSTFMVEMVETASILRNVTDKSLVILDEVGRGTSTYDGMSIAWAVVEFLHSYSGFLPKVLFATHYHELSALGDRLKGVFNLSMAVKEGKDGVEFLHQVSEGASNRSYGVEVARLAGLPRSVVARAFELLEELERKQETFADLCPPSIQMEFLDIKGDRVIQELTSLSLDQLSPIQALEKLYDLQKKAKKAVDL